MKYNNSILAAIVAVFFVSCGKDKLNTILDPGEVFSVYPIALTLPAEGGTAELDISGNEPWKLDVLETNSSAKDWYSFDKVSGTGAATVKVTLASSSSLVKNRRLLVGITGSSGNTMKAVILQETQVLGENEVLINGLIWSTVNVDMPGSFCTSPDETGMFYQFNRNTPWPGTGSAAPEGWSTDYQYEETDWQEVSDPSPEGWRVPTGQEIADLVAKGVTWAPASQTGFSADGIILGIPSAHASTATKATLKALGGIFLPKAGWRNADGVLDRDWLVAVRTATSLNKTMGGMFLQDSGGYQDLWGWGDGNKERAAMIRPVKKIKIED